MSSAQKTLELQRQVRQNAEEYRNQMSDLHTWQKEIKIKEQALKNAPNHGLDTAPVRSHVSDQYANKKTSAVPHSTPGNSAASTPTEKQDLPVDLEAQQHKKANDIKDRGNNYVKLADFEKAIEAYTGAVAVYAYDPVYYINRALCYLKQERFSECIEDCESAIFLDKLCVKAYYRRMQANESLGNNMEALKDCTTVLALEPKNSEAKKSLQRINDRLRSIANSKSGPNFTEERPDLIDILPFDKPAYKRSKEPLRRVPIVDILTPRSNKQESKELRISDEDIDKIFNSNCGPFEEVKREVKTTEAELSTTNVPTTKINQSTAKIIELKDNQKVAIEQDKTVTEKVQQKINIASTKDNCPIAQMKDKTNVTEAMDRTLPPAPTGTAQFYITWKELSSLQKYHYLKSIEISQLCKILGAGFDSETLTSILRTLNEYYVPNKESTTAKVLLEISKNEEFTILAMLMSKDEKKMLSSIMDAIKSDVSPKLFSALSKVYN